MNARRPATRSTYREVVREGVRGLKGCGYIQRIRQALPAVSLLTLALSPGVQAKHSDIQVVIDLTHDGNSTV